MSDKVVPIVRQGDSNYPTKNILSENLDHFQQKYRAVPILRQGGSNSPNGQNLSGNVDHQINLLYYSVSVSLKNYLVCVNQYLDVGKRNGH